MSINTAPIKWAQRSDSIYLTIALSDVKDESINLKDATLTFKGTSEGKEYAIDIEFFKDVNAEGSTYKTLPRSVQMHIMKKESDEEFWPRLLKDKTKEKNQVKIDWDRYVDEDDEADGFDTSALDGGMGMGGMPGMGGMGGMGGMDMEALMAQMGGMGGMGGMPGDMGMPGGNFGDDDEDDGDDDDDDDDDMPPLEES
ncbi:hypothetical protein FisN_11Hh028 [Fistulifera solaris]|uniref:CS domain-containing protein n=1 Tax=Fistulifera solaris TaxID=1519565 RepID=A0A1Z5JKJ0_FISSO|nr:hypothetical protein FisN_11Hh028 [Fistulifera solaris]|eukprot:GAX14509.1 hypothetical protein FisN_11Hh028 [Fistulifera solaris]